MLLLPHVLYVLICFSTTNTNNINITNIFIRNWYFLNTDFIANFSDSSWFISCVQLWEHYMRATATCPSPLHRYASSAVSRCLLQSFKNQIIFMCYVIYCSWKNIRSRSCYNSVLWMWYRCLYIMLKLPNRLFWNYSGNYHF